MNARGFKKIIIMILFMTTIGSTMEIAKAKVKEINQDVEITLLEENYKGGGTYKEKIKVTFNNQAYYNNQVMLSYHVYDKNKNADLQFENERIPIVLKEGTAILNVEVTLNKKIKEGIVKFDIVDEKNAYWFSQNKDIKMNTVEINHTYQVLKSIKAILSNEIAGHPIVFFINCLVSILSILMIFYIRKKEII